MHLQHAPTHITITVNTKLGFESTQSQCSALQLNRFSPHQFVITNHLHRFIIALSWCLCYPKQLMTYIHYCFSVALALLPLVCNNQSPSYILYCFSTVLMLLPLVCNNQSPSYILYCFSTVLMLLPLVSNHVPTSIIILAWHTHATSASLLPSYIHYCLSIALVLLPLAYNQSPTSIIALARHLCYSHQFPIMYLHPLLFQHGTLMLLLLVYYLATSIIALAQHLCYSHQFIITNDLQLQHGTCVLPLAKDLHAFCVAEGAMIVQVMTGARSTGGMFVSLLVTMTSRFCNLQLVV